MGTTINRRESATVINSLMSGVVPRVGLRHIAVGRQKEVNAFLQDIDAVENGGSAFRFVCGRYGSGKSFLLQMIRNNAMERAFVVMDADLSPERRLTGSKKQGLGTYKELMQHLSTNVRPDGGALESIMQKWITIVQTEASREKGINPTDSSFVDAIGESISNTLSDLSEMAYGFAFSSVINSYWRGMKYGNEELKQAALRWIRGEYATKTDARRELKVDEIIDDQNWYEFLKLFATFVTRTGYKGLLVFIDEGVNLYKIPNKPTRDSNYEKVLTMFNDTMQGKARHIGIFMSGTPEYIYDERRGLFSYEALRSRLSDNRFATQGFTDFTSPVIRLNQLSNEELYLLLERLRDLHSFHYSYERKLGASELTTFLNSIFSRLGTGMLLTPREITRDFLGLLNILYQNSNVSFSELIDNYQVKGAEKDPDQIDETTEKLFAEFDI